MKRKLIKQIDIALFQEGEIYIESEPSEFDLETLFCLYCKERINEELDEYIREDDTFYHKECHCLLHEVEDEEEDT